MEDSLVLRSLEHILMVLMPPSSLEIVLLIRIISQVPDEGIWIQALLRDSGLTILWFPPECLEDLLSQQVLPKAIDPKTSDRPLWIYGMAQLTRESQTRLSSLRVLSYQPKGQCSRLAQSKGRSLLSWKLYKISTHYYLQTVSPNFRYDCCLTLAIRLDRSPPERLQEVWTEGLFWLLTNLGLEHECLAQETRHLLPIESMVLNYIQETTIVPPSDPEIWRNISRIFERYLGLITVRD